MQRKHLLLVAALAAWAGQALAAEILYQTGFEPPAFTVGLTLREQDGWIGGWFAPGSSHPTVISTVNANEGAQCVRFDGADAQGNIVGGAWAARPLFDLDDPNPPATPQIRTSPDGASWTPRSSGTTEHLLDVAYGRGLFVATGFAGTILTSADGITWTQRPSGTGRRLFATTYGEGVFVTTGFGIRDDSGATVLTSTDGTHWTASSPPPAPTLNPYRGLGFGNGQFVMVGAIGIISTSPTGSSWTQRSAAPRVAPYGVTYGNGTWVAVGVDTNNGAGILTSTSAKQWTQRETGVTAEQLFGIGYGLDQFVAVGSTGLILTSTDGLVWKRRTSGTSFNLSGVTFGHGLFAICGTDFTGNPWRGTILTSTNGSNWTTRITQSGISIEGITFGNGLFVAVGLGGTIRTSTNGITWSPRASGTTAQLFSVAFGNGQFVAVSGSFSIVTSPDGITWTPRATAAADEALFYTVRYGGGVFVTCGEGGSEGPIYTSLDGVQWTRRSSGLDTQINGLAFADGVFVAAGGGSIISCDIRPRFTRVALSNRLAQVSFSGVSGLNYAVDASTNLVDWSPLTNVVATNGFGEFDDESLLGSHHRFYRVKYP